MLLKKQKRARKAIYSSSLSKKRISVYTWIFLTVWKEPLFILRIIEWNSSVMVRFEILLWLNPGSKSFRGFQETGSRRKLVDSWSRCWWGLDWVSTKVSIECRLEDLVRKSINTQPQNLTSLVQIIWIFSPNFLWPTQSNKHGYSIYAVLTSFIVLYYRHGRCTKTHGRTFENIYCRYM